MESKRNYHFIFLRSKQDQNLLWSSQRTRYPASGSRGGRGWRTWRRWWKTQKEETQKGSIAQQESQERPKRSTCQSIAITRFVRCRCREMRGKREKKKVELWVSVSGEISTKWRRSGPYEKPARGWLLVQTICRPFVSTRCWIVRKRQYSFIYSIRFTIWNSNFRLFFQGYVRRILWRFVTISRRVFWFNP